MGDFDFSNIEGFEWDIGNLNHIKKHGVSFEECQEAFVNQPVLITKDDKHSKIERRYRLFGRTNMLRLITIVFTVRNEQFRIISGRDQSKKERQEFIENGGGN